MSQFYEIDSTRVSHQEYWWGSKSPLVILGWLIKWLHIRIPSSSDDPNTDSTLPFVVESLPPEIAAGFEPLTQELAALGFSDPVCHVIHDPGTRTTVYWATFRHESGKYFARIHQRIWQQASKSDRGIFPMFVTAFTDGTFLVSSAGKPDMAAPATVQMNRMYRAKATRLWEAHQRLADQAGNRKMVAPATSPAEVVAMTEQLHIRLRDFHLTRKVFRPRTAAEQAKADAFSTSVAQAQAGGLEHAEVMAELDRLQEKKSGWGAAAWVLVGSLVLFLALGAARWNWKFTLWIIPVLLFHECGHWAAMRIFHYRNLRMFFIPLFGAAVMGQNWNVPGWKKALVSLAGPLPGIALGVVLGITGLVLKKLWLDEAALMLLFLNGLNLLPVLPLDGGHVLHSILFCRNRWLDITFRILAIGSLFLLSVWGLGKVFLYLAILMTVGLPMVFKLGQVTDTLRNTPLPPPLPDEDRIPAPTAQAIISALKATLPRATSNKMLAQHTVNIFETLNAKPPGALGTAGLLLLHGGSMFLAVVFASLLFVAQYNGLGDFARAAARQPKHSFSCGSAQHWPGDEARRNPAPAKNLLVATFKNHVQAASQFTKLTRQVSPDDRLTLFGDSVLLVLPANDDNAREKWFDWLQEQTTNVFVAPSNQPVMVSLTLITPTAAAATNLSRDLGEYVEVTAGMALIPPWSPEAKKPDFKTSQQARRDWRRIGLELAEIWRNPALTNYPAKIRTAAKRGDLKEIDRLEAEQQKLGDELRMKTYQELRNRSTNHIDPALLDLHQRLMKLGYTNRVERAATLQELAPHLGRVKYDGDKPAPGADAYGACLGDVTQHGLLVEVWIQLNDAPTGLPSLADWLCDLGCAQIRYEISGGFRGAEVDE